MAPVSSFLLAVLLAIARKGSSIECQKCHTINAKCTGSIQVCSPEFDACKAIVVETNTSTRIQKAIIKGCTVRKKCTPGPIFMDLKTEYQESGDSICCTTDGCNNVSLTVPTRNETLNGLKCPFCYSKRYETCKEEVTDCRGSETQCFTRRAGEKMVSTINSVTTISYQITQKGCATESFCANIAEAGFIISGISYVGTQEIQCRAASGTSIALESTQLCLQAFVAVLMTTFYHGLL